MKTVFCSAPKEVNLDFGQIEYQFGYRVTDHSVYLFMSVIQNLFLTYYTNFIEIIETTLILWLPFSTPGGTYLVLAISNCVILQNNCYRGKKQSLLS